MRKVLTPRGVRAGITVATPPPRRRGTRFIAVDYGYQCAAVIGWIDPDGTVWIENGLLGAEASQAAKDWGFKSPVGGYRTTLDRPKARTPSTRSFKP